MKKLLIVPAIMVFGLNASAQNYAKYDTLRKNELSVSLSPALLLMAGANEFSNNINFNFGYKRYFKDKYVLRLAVVLFTNTNNSYLNGIPRYHSTVDTFNIFVSNVSGGGLKSQLNIGLEKIYKVNRLTHGIGADLFFNHKFTNNAENFTWQSTKHPQYNSYTGYNPSIPNNYVDSLGYTRRGSEIGIGFQLFYSLRYNISKHWLLSTTIGPSVHFSIFKGTWYDRRTKKEYSSNAANLDFPNVPLISDVSLAFRF